MTKLAAVVLFLLVCVSAQPDALAKSIMKVPALKFTEFAGDPEGVPVRFEYPDDWKLQKEKGKLELYHSIRLLGPRNREDTYSSYFSIVASPVREEGGKFGNLAELVKNFKDSLLPGTEVQSEDLTVVGGQGAVDIAITTTLKPSYHKGLKSKDVPLKTRVVFTQKGTVLYRITYSADVRAFPAHSRAFDRLLETLQFLK